CSHNDPSVVKDFDLGRFQGHWYEIARITGDYDTDCSNTTADYQRTGSSNVDMQYACTLPSGNTQSFAATPCAEEPSAPAKLTMQISADQAGYWVLDVNASYDYLLVGSPSRARLWVLSRTPTLDAALYEHARSVATQQGYDANSLVRTPQSAPKP